MLSSCCTYERCFSKYGKTGFYEHIETKPIPIQAIIQPDTLTSIFTNYDFELNDSIQFENDTLTQIIYKTDTTYRVRSILKKLTIRDTILDSTVVRVPVQAICPPEEKHNGFFWLKYILIGIVAGLIIRYFFLKSLKQWLI